MEKAYVIVGTYTKLTSEGIYVYQFDEEKGRVHLISTCNVRNPSFIDFCRRGKFLYSVSENEKGDSYANALVFNHDSGKMEYINRRVTKGEGACHIALDSKEKYVVTANYGGGSISVFPLEEDGKLGVLSQYILFFGSSKNSDRQEASHPHCSAFSPDGKCLFVTDLGTDTIYRFTLDYSLDKKFLLEDTRKDFPVKEGSGPRHLVFDKNGQYLYVVNELRGTVLVYKYSAGDLLLIQEVSIDNELNEGGGGITLSPDGKCLFVSMREGNDGIAVFRINKEGLLSHLGYYNVSEHPRDITVSPDGRYLLIAAMNDNRVEVRTIASDGKLQDITDAVSVSMPTFVGFFSDK